MGDNGYQYHCFISYRRGRRENGRVLEDDVERWVLRFFLPQLQNKLADALEEQARIFCDQIEIHAGDQWERTIVEALRASMCLVSVWSPLYFQSEWCVSEWATFEGAGPRPVVPLLWQREVTLPGAAKPHLAKDFSEFAYTSASFSESQKHLAFEDAVRVLARDVKRAIDKAPGHDPSWPVVVPGQSPGTGSANVLLLGAFPALRDMLVTRPSRISRRDLTLAA